MDKMNSKMEKAIGKIQKSKRKNRLISTQIVDIMWPSFVEIEECVLFRSTEEEAESLNLEFVLKSFGDRSGFEAFSNHIHAIDITDDFVKHPSEGLKFMLKLMEVWECKLRRDFPHYKFFLTLSHGGKDSILRFHRLRDNEPSWIDIDKLEDLKKESIFVKIVE